MENDNQTIKIAIPLTIAFFALIIAFSSWYTVDQGERAVILRNGAAIGTAEPGLHFKFPIIDRVVFISMDIYSTYGSVEGLVDRVLRPKVNDSTKEVFGQFTAVSVIQDRAKFGTDVYQSVVDVAGKYLIIESIQIENIDFSNAYEQSIEQRMLAEVEVQKVRQNWEKEKVSADITRTKAQAEADARLAQATAQAKAIEMTGQAEASAIQAKGAALRDNPALVALIQAEKWDGKLPNTMVPGSAVPFLSVK